MSIRDYLCRVAAEITDNSLADIATKEQWLGQRSLRYEQYMEMQGMPHLLPPLKERSPLNTTITGTVKRNDFTIEKLHYQPLPQLYIAANLYIPTNLTTPAPAVVYVCGHSDKPKEWYQPHARRWAQLGFVTLIVDTIRRSEIKGEHHGCYQAGQFQWYSRGYTPGGVEMYCAIRALDLLQNRDEVDGEKIGITGISGGGATSWWAGAADERFKAIAPVCGTGTVKAHLKDRTWDGHCDCMMFINTYLQELSDCGALIAPRPLMTGSADRDGIYSIESIRKIYTKVKSIYDLYGASDNCQLIETPGPHSYHRTSRTGIYSFFIKHLMGKDMSPKEIEDNSEFREDDEVLRVFVNGIPGDEITTTIQESFIPLAEPPQIETEADLIAHRTQVVENLKAKTFRHFPQTPCDLDAEIDLEHMSGETKLARWRFTSEQDWRLTAETMFPKEAQNGKAPLLIFLNSKTDFRWEYHAFINSFDPTWARLAFECRGIGETSWGYDLQWHIRRSAAITGRTIASMQVYDALRAIEFARTLDTIDPDRIAIAGSGQMATVAMYAALLDGNLEAVILENPPASQNLPDPPNCRDYANEMLNCLRFTDLPDVAAMLYPADLVFITPRPETYRLTDDIYNKLGGRIVRPTTLAQYTPAAK